MTTRTASCRCGQLKVTVAGDLTRASVCHCLNCKKRSGSSFAAQARWPVDNVKIEGRSDNWTKVSESGNRATFHFCPDCGSDVYYDINDSADGLLAIPLGAFDDPFFFKPDFSVFENRKHEWIEITGDVVHD